MARFVSVGSCPRILGDDHDDGGDDGDDYRRRLLSSSSSSVPINAWLGTD